MARGALHIAARRVRNRGLLPVLLTLVFVSLGAQPPEHTSGGLEASTEYRVKAAFLYNFTKYVKWPEEAFERADAPLVVAVVGKDPFGKALDDTLKGKSIGKHPLVVRRYSGVNELGNCHLLFVPSRRRGDAAKIAARYAGTSTLLVGESDGFTQGGGAIRFFIEKKKVRFEVNTDAARRARVEISSQLLKLARIVTDEKKAR